MTPFADASRVPARTSARRATAALFAFAAASPSAIALAPGQDGIRVTIPVSGTDDVARAAVLAADGSVVMAGATGAGTSALAAITRAGAIDPAFGGGDGIVTFNLSTSTDTLNALVRLYDGRYIGCGAFFSPGTASDFVVLRFMSDGSLDTSFDGAGYVVTPFLTSGSGDVLFDQCNAVAVQADGMIVSAGVTDENGPPHLALMRHTTDGQLDPTFGNGGKIDLNAGANSNGSSEAHALLVQPDGKLLVAGYATGPGNDDDFLILRLDSDGTPDATFGTGGITRTPVGAGEDIANALVLQPDGRIVIAGSSVADVGRRDFALARYTSAGALDATFGTGGLATTPVGPGDDIAYALALMPWGRLVAAGSARISTSAPGTDLAVIAYNADGNLDRYFGDAGVRMIDISGVSTAVDSAYALVTDIDGEHFWAIGTTQPTTSQDFLAIELGLPDTIFRHGFDSNTSP